MLTELPPDPLPNDRDSPRLVRLEVKVNVLIVLVSILILEPILSWVFGFVQTSAWLMLILLAVALVIAFFREHIPGVLKRSARWLVVKAINAEAVAIDNKAFELWTLPASGQPRSLGLLPVTEQRVEVILSPQLLAILQNTAGLAVSVEPPGGSPTGLPTGPVVYQTSILEL